MLNITLMNGRLTGIESAHESTLAAILEYHPDFMESVIAVGDEQKYYTNDVDGSLEDAKSLAKSFDEKGIPYGVLCYCNETLFDEFWGALRSWGQQK